MPALLFIGDQQTIADLQALAVSEDVETSSIESIGSEDTRFQSPITLDDVNNVLQTVSLVFSTGSAALAFIGTLRKALEQKNPQQKTRGVEVRDATTNAQLGTIAPGQSSEEFERRLLQAEARRD
jgi:hypothetical protein